MVGHVTPIRRATAPFQKQGVAGPCKGAQSTYTFRKPGHYGGSSVYRLGRLGAVLTVVNARCGMHATCRAAVPTALRAFSQLTEICRYYARRGPP